MNLNFNILSFQYEFYSYTSYYNFDEGDVGSQAFDVTECFAKSDRIEIRFKFPYKGIQINF